MDIQSLNRVSTWLIATDPAMQATYTLKEVTALLLRQSGIELFLRCHVLACLLTQHPSTSDMVCAEYHAYLQTLKRRSYQDPLSIIRNEQVL